MGPNNQHQVTKKPFVTLFDKEIISVFDFERELREFIARLQKSQSAIETDTSADDLVGLVKITLTAQKYTDHEKQMLFDIMESLVKNNDEIYDYFCSTRISIISAYFQPLYLTLNKTINVQKTTFTIHTDEFTKICKNIDNADKEYQAHSITKEILAQDIPFDEQLQQLNTLKKEELMNLTKLINDLIKNYQNTYLKLEENNLEKKKQFIKAKIQDLTNLSNDIKTNNLNTLNQYQKINQTIETKIIKLYTICHKLIIDYDKEKQGLPDDSQPAMILENKINILTSLKSKLIPDDPENSTNETKDTQTLQAHLHREALEEKYQRMINFETQLSANFKNLSQNRDTKFKTALKMMASVIILPTWWFTTLFLDSIWKSRGEQQVEKMKILIKHRP